MKRTCLHTITIENQCSEAKLNTEEQNSREFHPVEQLFEKRILDQKDNQFVKNFVRMKYIIALCLVAALSASAIAQSNTSFYDFVVKDIYGNDFKMSSLKGKKVLIVNTASKCGFTPQFADLEKLYDQYKSKNFVVIGFPTNDFKNQDPGTNTEILEFCQKNYGVTFPMMEKISVKGDSIHPLYVWLTKKQLNGVVDSSVKWNFQKYMIDEKGNFVDFLWSMAKPDNEKIVDWIKGNE